MTDIMIKCPPTGITTEMIILDTLDFPLSMHCPACRQFHTWSRSDAWIAKDDYQNKADFLTQINVRSN